MRRHPGRRELAVFAIAYLTYFGVRAVTEGRIDRALANATSLLHVEDALGIAWESTVQSLVAGSHLLQDVVNWIYIFGHWPVIIGAGVLLFRYRREHYYTLRNVCLLTGTFGLVVFALFPVAPPRLTDLPLMDTVTRGAAAYRQLLPPRLVNQYAAMPSFHAGWNLAVGIVVFRATRNPLLRAFAIAMPAAMAFSVVATANHFVIDVVVGVTLVLLAFRVEHAIASVPPSTRRERPRASHGRNRVPAAGQPSTPTQRPLPEARPGQLLPRVEACGTCRTDPHLLDGEVIIRDPPRDPLRHGASTKRPWSCSDGCEPERSSRPAPARDAAGYAASGSHYSAAAHRRRSRAHRARARRRGRARACAGARPRPRSAGQQRP